jgi:hypothetical protein
MRQYFSNHPVIEYRGLNIRNLMLSARVVKDVLSKSTLLYPYTLEEGETPTMLAYDYYGNIDYVWLIFLANNMIDPVTDWYKSQDDFDQYLIKKYGSIEEAMGTIHHYRSISDLSAPEVSAETYQYATLEERGLLSPVSAYDFEVSSNEIKRNINLIDRSQAAKISLELERLL